VDGSVAQTLIAENRTNLIGKHNSRMPKTKNGGMNARTSSKRYSLHRRKNIRGTNKFIFTVSSKFEQLLHWACVKHSWCSDTLSHAWLFSELLRAEMVCTFPVTLPLHIVWNDLMV